MEKDVGGKRFNLFETVNAFFFYLKERLFVFTVVLTKVNWTKYEMILFLEIKFLSRNLSIIF